MKIIHTADWHLGKQLHRYSLEDDHQLFLDWLANLIIERNIDLLLIAGDVFDSANPSTQALTQYYGFLRKLIGVNCQVVITGGNHDSAGVLNAPKELLKYLNIKIVGSAMAHIQEELIPIECATGAVVIGAVPYLREVDLRKSVAGLGYDDRLEALRQGIHNHYQLLADFRKADYPNLPFIVMGHLYMSGAVTSESERDIHVVGGEAAFSADYFPAGADYVALGHIHKPQKINNSDYFRYSGSPIPLSFSEREDHKFVVELTLQNNENQPFAVQAIAVPLWRELRSFVGNLEEVETALKTYQPQTELPPYVEVHITEPTYDPQKEVYYNYLIREFDKAPFKIIKPRLTFENRLRGADELFIIGTAIQDLTPQQVFERRLNAEKNLDEETKLLLLEAFDELCREVQEKS